MATSSTVRTYSGLASIFFAILAFILMAAFASNEDTEAGYLGGLNADHLFSYHPVFMTLGMVTFSIMALNSYAVLPLEHTAQKTVHVVFHTCALVCFALGLSYVVKAHNEKLLPNLNSMHSWVGLAAAVMYVQNYLFGFVFFLTGTQTRQQIRAYMPTHLTLGLFSLALTMAATISGIQTLGTCGYTTPLTEPDTNPASHYANDTTEACKVVQGAGICILCAVLCSMYALVPHKPPHHGLNTALDISLDGQGQVDGSDYSPPNPLSPSPVRESEKTYGSFPVLRD